MIYLTSDLHFGHNVAFIYEPRGFKSIEDMNETLIRNWNEDVTDDDDVYVLGDFFLGTDDEFVINTINRLHGKIHLILGNHDTDAKIALYKNCPKIVNYIEQLDRHFPTSTEMIYNGRKYLLSHYKTFTAELTSDPNTAVINLSGHVHQPEKFYRDMPFMYNVSVDAHENRLVSIDQIAEDIKNQMNKCFSFLV